MNTLFQKDYPANHRPNIEHNELFKLSYGAGLEQVVTDLVFSIGSDRYHLECQSTDDGTMLVRMFEYDSMLSLRNSQQVGNRLMVNFPESAVMYLRTPRDEYQHYIIEIHAGANRIEHQIPIINVNDYSIEQIADCGLWMFVPFYLFRYEKRFKAINNDDVLIAELIRDIANVFVVIQRQMAEEKLDNSTASLLVDCMSRVSEKLTKNHIKLKKEVLTMLESDVLTFSYEKYFEEGREEGREEGMTTGIDYGLKIAINRLIQSGNSIEDISRSLAISTEEIVRILALPELPEALCL